jgi:predicted dehydrogenase
MNKKTKILVCGAGSIGQRHIQNLKSLNVDVSAWRSRRDLVEELSQQYRIVVNSSIDKALSRVDGVVVATSTSEHIKIALKAAKLGKAIFIEKPVSSSLDELKPLLKEVTDKNLIIEIGFQLRAHPNLIKLIEIIKQDKFGPLYTYRAVVGQRLDTWRPGTDYRNSYSASKDQGGGALLDLIHEIDLIHWLTGSIGKVFANMTNASDLEMSAEDLVNLILVNKNGSVGQIQLDMLSPVYRRELELVFRDAIFYWNDVTGILEKRMSSKSLVIDKTPKIFNRNTLFLTHMKHFIRRINGEVLEPLCSLNEGVEVQKIAEAARLSSKLNKTVELKEFDL